MRAFRKKGQEIRQPMFLFSITSAAYFLEKDLSFQKETSTFMSNLLKVLGSEVLVDYIKLKV